MAPPGESRADLFREAQVGAFERWRRSPGLSRLTPHGFFLFCPRNSVRNRAGGFTGSSVPAAPDRKDVGVPSDFANFAPQRKQRAANEEIRFLQPGHLTSAMSDSLLLLLFPTFSARR